MHQRRELLLIAGLGVLVNKAFAAESEFSGQLRVGEIYTSNVRLAPPDEAQHDNVLEVSPSFVYSRSSPRLDLDLEYDAQAYVYNENPDGDGVYHQLYTQALVTLAPERFYLDTLLTNDQTIVDPTAILPLGNIGIIDNRVDLATATIAPFIALSPGRADGVVRYDYSRLDYDDPEFQDVNYDVFEFSLGRDEFGGATWLIDYAYERADYDEFNAPILFQHFEVQGGYWLAPSLRVFTTQGVEDDFHFPTEGDLDLRYWDVGFTWEPGSRTHLEFAAGERNFGRSASFEWTTQLRRGVVGVSYTETPTTQSRVRLANLRQSGAADITEYLSISSALDRAGDSSVYVAKILQGNMGLAMNRSFFDVRVYREEHSDRVEPFQAPAVTDDPEELQGFEVGWSWTFRPSARLFMGVTSIDRILLNEPEDDLISFDIGVDFSLGARMYLTFQAARVEREATGDDGDYEENQLRIGFVREFESRQSRAAEPAGPQRLAAVCYREC